MLEEDFLKLVEACNFNEDYHQYLQSHNIEDILNLINKRASWVEMQNIEYIIDILLYSVNDESRKFSGSFVYSKYNYISKFSDSITKIYSELQVLMNNAYQGNKKINSFIN